jgi:hypothetical protein
MTALRSHPPVHPAHPQTLALGGRDLVPFADAGAEGCPISPLNRRPPNIRPRKSAPARCGSGLASGDQECSSYRNRLEHRLSAGDQTTQQSAWIRF